DWPTFQKKLISVTDAPHMIAAPQETRTPIFPRPARCGLLLFAPNPHTIADTMSANTLRMRPTVMTAPTMVRNWLMPGSPELLGSISICIGNNAERTGVASARAVRVFTIQAPSIRGSTVLLPEQVRPGRSEEHTSELQSRFDLVCRLLLDK